MMMKITRMRTKGRMKETSKPRRRGRATLQANQPGPMMKMRMKMKMRAQRERRVMKMRMMMNR